MSATIKRQLCLILPGVKCFLDVRPPSNPVCRAARRKQAASSWQVDDLKCIDDLEDYVDQSAVIMIFVSRGYVRPSTGLPLRQPVRWTSTHTLARSPMASS